MNGPVDDLTSLWRRRLESLAMAVLKDQHDHEELANLAEHIGHDYKGRFLIELLQNANDQCVPESGEPPELGLGEAGTVAIVAADGLVGVFNQGRPFSDGGLDAITSLAFSNKDAEVHVGNKGVGFKSVYQVTDRPMLVSRREGTGGLSSAGSAPWAVCLSLAPFDACAALQAELQSTLGLVEESYGQLVPELVEKFGSMDAAQAALELAARSSAPFKYPIPLQPDEVRACFDALAINDAFLARFQTAVLLPLRPEASPVVEEALAELTDANEGPPGALVLTTPGLSRVTVRAARDADWVMHGRWGLQRQDGAAPGIALFEVETGRWSGDGPDDVPEEELIDRTSWVGGRTVYGSVDRGHEHPKEQQTLRDAMAASQMPGKGWESVRSAPVLVALPKNRLLERWTSSKPDGRITIALPTRHPTGAHWTVDSRFQGTLSRTDLNLGTAYNALLLNEAVALSGQVLAHLRASEAIEDRRLATLALEAQLSEWEFAESFWGPGGPARGATVLGADEESWIAPDALRLPERADVEHKGLRVFEELIRDLSPQQLQARFPELPERVLLTRHFDRIREVARIGRLPRPASPHPIPVQQLLGRPGNSLVEQLARRKRDAGPGFWKKFLGWLMVKGRSRWKPLLGLSFLPTGRADLSSPKSRVFARRAGDEGADESPPLESLPEALLDTLPFLDEEAVPVRQGDGRTFSEFGRRLVEESPLVRSPRLSELVDEVVGPELQAAAEAERTADALALLSLVLGWTRLKRPLRAESAREVTSLRVPVRTVDGGTAWVHPTHAYFGEGWLDDTKHEELLATAYGETGRRLLPRDKLEVLGEGALGALKVLGVSTAPKLLVGKAGSAPLHANRNGRIERSENEAFPRGLPSALEARWSAWIDAIDADRLKAATTSKQGYGPTETVWIDGLEREGAARQAVFDLMLREPALYARSARTRIRRTSTNVNQDTDHPRDGLWAWNLRKEQWALVPTAAGGRTTVDSAWLLEREQRRRPLAALLDVCDVGYPAWELLEALGVPQLAAEAPACRLIDALQRLAGRLPLEPPDRRPGATLARTMLELLAGKGTLSEDDWAQLLAGPIPLERGLGRSLEAHSLSELGETVYVDDDSVRARHIAGFGDALRLPGRADQLIRGGFIEQLADRLPPNGVMRTSRADVDHGFVGESVGHLLPWLEEQADERALLAVAATLVVGGGQVADPYSKDGRFKRRWTLLGKVDLRLGDFPLRPDGRSEGVFFDGRDRALLLSEDRAHAADAIEALWHIAGKGYQHVFPRLSAAVRADRVESFLEELGYGPPELEDLASAIGRGGIAALRRHEASVLVEWRSRDAGGALDAFKAVVRDGRLQVESALAALGLADLEPKLRTAGLGAPNEVALSWFGADGLEAWQEARAELGEPPWIFEETRAALASLWSEVAARVMSDVAHERPGTAPEVAACLKALSSDDPLAALTHGRPSDAELTDAIVEVVADALSEAGEDTTAGRLKRRRGSLAKLGTAREVSEYLEQPAPRRAAEATNALGDILRVARAVAADEGEELAESDVRADPGVTAYATDLWANRFALLAVLRSVLEACAPRVEVRLRKAKAFRAPPESWRALWDSVPGLPPPPEGRKAPEKPVEAAGRTWTRAERDRVVGAGSSGAIGEALRAAAPDLDIVETFLEGRGLVPERRTGGSAGGGGGGGGKGDTGGSETGGGGGSGGKWGRNPPREDATTGMLGEAFVYEWLKKALPAEADLRWVSKAAAKYGVSGENNDGMGYDLEFKDVAGSFGPAGHRCFVEVKATKADSSRPFPMSWPEWRRAKVAARTPGESYVIVRVTSALSKKPRIADVLVDPASMERAGQIELRSKDLWVRVAPVRAAEPPPSEESE